MFLCVVGFCVVCLVWCVFMCVLVLLEYLLIFMRPRVIDFDKISNVIYDIKLEEAEEGDIVLINIKSKNTSHTTNHTKPNKHTNTTHKINFKLKEPTLKTQSI